MPTTLQSRLGDLALSFSDSVLEAIRRAPIEELFGASSSRRKPAATSAAPRPAAPVLHGARAPRRRAGRLPRRSAADVERIVNEIVALLREHPEGLRAEEIRGHLGLMAKELPRPLKDAVASRRLKKSGAKRATTYSLGGASGGAKGSAPRAAKAVKAAKKGKGRAARRAAAAGARTPKKKAARRGAAPNAGRRTNRSAKKRRAVRVAAKPAAAAAAPAPAETPAAT